MKRLVPLLAALMLGMAFGPSAAAESRPLTVVELFTSQGCSSCPPADAFLGDLARERELLALSFHVDYWDYIGWRDPFARGEHTQRQREYARRFGLKYVFTPQIVVQGEHQATGSDRTAVRAGIRRAQSLPRIDVVLEGTPQALRIRIEGGVRAADADVLLVGYDRAHETAIRRGENRGRALTNYNVVKSLARVGHWTGQELAIETAMTADGPDACAVIVQSRQSGRILGAAMLALDR